MNRSHLWLTSLLAGSTLAGPALAQDIDDTCAARAVGPPSAEQEAIIEGYRIDHPDIDIPVRTSVTIAAINDHPDGRICAVRAWTVNGIKDGDARVGTITSDGAIATYHAPAKPPPGHKVRILADITTPTTVGVRQVQVPAVVTVLDPMASVCHPPKGGKQGGAKGCEYVAVTIPRVVPSTGPRDDFMWVRKASLEIDENEYGEPVQWSMTVWTSYGSAPSALSETTFGGKLSRQASGVFQMSYFFSSTDKFRLELTSETAKVEGLAVLGYEGQESARPMGLELRRNPDDFITAEEADAMRAKIEAATKEYLTPPDPADLDLAPLEVEQREQVEQAPSTPPPPPTPPLVPQPPRKGAGR